MYSKKVSKEALELYNLSKLPPAKPRPNKDLTELHLIELMTEIGHQIECLNEGISDKDEFIQAINEIHEYHNTTIL